MGGWQGCQKYEHGSFFRLALTLVTCMVLLLVSGSVLAATYAPRAEVAETEWHDWHRGYWLFGTLEPNLSRLDEQLVDNGFGSLDGFFSLWGGGTFSESARVAVAGMVGTGAASSARGSKYARLNTGFGLVELAYVFPGNGWHMQLGGMFGAGGSSLVLSEGRPSSIDDAARRRYDTYVTQGFALIGPSVGLRADLSKYNALHFKTGYLWALSGPWMHYSSDTLLSGGPNLSSPFIAIGFTSRFGRTHRGPGPYDGRPAGKRRDHDRPYGKRR